MSITKEEHARNQRRRARQVFGLVLVVLVLVGVGTVVHAAANAIGGLFDTSDEFSAYSSKLEGFVMFDPLPFDGVENMDDTTLRESAVWGTVYSVLDTETGLDGYEHDAEERVMLPAVEVDAYLARVLGPTFKLDHKTFDTEDMTILYDDASQCYLIPITSSVGSYSPVVTAMFKRSGQLYVTVGYVPVTDEFDITTATSANQPTKYMDYIFTRTHGNWFLTGLTESETVVPTPAATAAADAASTPEVTDVDSAILAGVQGEEAGSALADSSAASQEADAASAAVDSAAASDSAASAA